MPWNSLTITLADTSDAETVEEHFLELGAVAVTFTDAGDEPILEPELNTQPLWSETNINALFELDIDLAVVKASLDNEIGANAFVVIDQGQIEDKEWEREWMEHFKPMQFGERLWICPENMQIPEEQQDENNVIVDMDPGLAFGTGTHETTSMCLHWLDSANLDNKTVLDYGCGSGILAIAALKLGAKKATCVDIDIQAIEASVNNAERNSVSKKLHAYVSDDPDWSGDEKYDLILANILASPLIALVHDIRQRVNPQGQIVLSGILAEQEELVRSVYAPYFNFSETRQDSEWICLSGTIKTPAQLLGEEEKVTYCPECQESFYIAAEDLELAAGKVRCGECEHVFYALDHLDPISDEDKSNLNNPVDTGKIPRAHLITGMWLHQKDGLTPVEIRTQSDANTLLEKDTRIEPQLNVPDEVSEPVEKSSAQPAVDTAADDEIPFNLDDLENLKKPTRIKHHMQWLLLSVFSLLFIGAQYVHQHRNQLALHPKLGPGILAAYDYLPLDIEPDWELDAYQINSSKVGLNPEHKNELVASFNLSNTASFAQSFPIIRLSLFNRWGERIAYRDLGVNEYLPSEETQQDAANQQSSMLAARGRVDVRVMVKDPGSEAMDFSVEICLKKSGAIRCQDKT